MLEISKTLNTINFIFYSKKVKDITMNNQQVAKLIFNFRFLRDYMRRVFHFERLRNSPTNNKNINLYLNNLKLFLKLINVRLNKLYNLSILNYSTTIINNNKSNKINPN
jgi:hypothetical protein